jgi:hypothetical protein
MYKVKRIMGENRGLLAPVQSSRVIVEVQQSVED